MQANNGQIRGPLLRLALRMNSAKWLDETGMFTFTFESIFIFTLFGKFERWVLFVFEGCTLTIPPTSVGGIQDGKEQSLG
jgi:hypothetical protein